MPTPSLRRLDAVSDQLPAAIFAVHLDGRILDVNAAALGHYGFDREELLAMTVRELRAPANRADFPARLAQVRIEPMLFETVHVRKDAREFPCEVSTRPIERDGEHFLVAIVRDLSERKLAAEREVLLGKVFNANPVVISIVNLLDNTYVNVNQSYLNLYGFRREEVIGKTFLDLGFKIEQDQLMKLATAVMTRDTHDFEITMRVPDGRWLTGRQWLEFLELDGKPCVVSCGLDVTAHKRMEEQLRQAQKMEAIGQLAGGVAHDFNNILTAILGNSEVLLSSLDEKSPLRRQAEQIRKAGLRAASLTGQLLAFSRKQVLQPKVLDLNALVSNLSVMLQRLIGEDVELLVEFEPQLGSVRADPGQLEQVVLNLVVNARDAMPNGGQLSLRTANVPGRVLLEVADTGRGMDAETQARVFEPFFTTKRPGKGTGLGLSTVYGIVTQSGGQVEVESAPGQGSRFRIYLPQVAERAAPGESRPTLLPHPQGRERILLCEDDAQVRDFVRQVLASLGYDVHTAADGEEALRLAGERAHGVHLLVTDVIMPKMNGRELAERLTALRPEVRVLFISGYPGDALSPSGASAPAELPLQKPFSISELAHRVRAILDGRR